MYKLKEGVELPKEFKIKVNPKQSEALQKHLFTLGIFWAIDKSNVKLTEYPFLYIGDNMQGNRITFSDKYDKIYFEHKNILRIKFKDYFEKVEETSFPEKWCIEVTEDNYKELDVYLHRNWKDYENYTDKWKVAKKSIGNYFSNKTSFGYGGHSYKNLKEASIADCELITTEQFRKQFGDLRPKDVEIGLVSTKPIEKKMLDHLNKCNQITSDQKSIIEMKDKEIVEWKIENAKLQNRLDYYKEKSNRLRREKWEMSKDKEYKEAFLKISKICDGLLPF